MTPLIPLRDFDHTVRKLRAFFQDRNFVEVHTQNRLSILAACEDPTTVATFNYMGEVWPLPQTGQMWLEHDLLRDKSLPGVFCLSTSYRQEPNPVPGRHDLIFPMFEFEAPGTMADLIQLEKDLCENLGYGNQKDFGVITYQEAGEKYAVKELEHTHEKIYAKICIR